MLLIRSLQLDIDFLKLEIPLSKKLSFFIEKYFSVVSDILHLQSNKVAHIFGNQYFYDDAFSLGVFQGTYNDNAFLKKFIPKGSVVVDVGANIGQFNLFCKDYLGVKKVYSFEPIEKTFSLLKKNCKSNVYNYAISSKSSLIFYIAGLSVWSSSINHSEMTKTENVKGIKLDSFLPLKNEKIIDLFKIDTEGAELGVLKVSKTILQKSRYILIEIPIIRTADSSFFEIFKYLHDILPDIEVVRIGRVYNNEEDGTTGATDILFYNKNFNKK